MKRRHELLNVNGNTRRWTLLVSNQKLLAQRQNKGEPHNALPLLGARLKP
jgi:hypothetical protein